MAQKVLTVYASDNGSLVVNIAALEANIRRFVGRVYDEEVKGFVKKSEPETLAYKHEYRQAVIDGDLVAANQETADICGVKFNQ